MSLNKAVPAALAMLLLCGSGHLAAAPDDEAKRIAGLIAQLGSDSYEAREAASKALIECGEGLLPALCEGAQRSGDPEVQQRALEIQYAILGNLRKSPATGLELALILEGEFVRGSPEKETSRGADEGPVNVAISRPFLLGAYEVKQAEFQRVMKRNPSWFSRQGGGRERIGANNPDRLPVEQVSWYDAIEFCNELSRLDGFPPYYSLLDVRREAGAIVSATVSIRGGHGYRLPTEAEWEYACRAGTTTAFGFGEASAGREGNFKVFTRVGAYGEETRILEQKMTIAAGGYKANDWGLFDMHGNVAEWCWDWYQSDAAGGLDPKGPDAGRHRTLRGGSWLLADKSCRSASRAYEVPTEAKFYAGFRVARSPTDHSQRPPKPSPGRRF